MAANNDLIMPGYSATQTDIDRTRKIADALRSMSMEQPQGQMVSGWYVPPSWAQNLATVANAHNANKMDAQAKADQATLAQRYGEALREMVVGKDVPSTPVPVQSQQIDASQPILTGQISNAATENMQNMLPTTRQGGINIPGMSDEAKMKYAMLDMQGLVKAGLDQYSPTDATKMAMAAGSNVQQANQGALEKANYIAPIAMRQGGGLVDPRTNQMINFSPKMPDNSLPIIQNGRIVGVTPLPNAQAIEQQNAYAAEAGKRGYNPNQAPITMPHGVPTAFGPTSDASIKAFGQGQEQQLAAMDKSWTALNEQNKQAQATNSYLQNIKTLANKAAVGPASDKKALANGLLSLVGVKGAEDATTANNLMDKYQGQIIARLGQGGMGTDAARALLSSAYPGSHMNKEAINEAVDNIVGANEMTKAKTNLLSQHAATRDPIAYQQKEVIFDQNADPRLYQYKAIAGTPEGKIFLQNALKQDPDFLNKAKRLHEIGAF